VVILSGVASGSLASLQGEERRFNMREQLNIIKNFIEQSYPNLTELEKATVLSKLVMIDLSDLVIPKAS
jgi:hypothetical protein